MRTVFKNITAIFCSLKKAITTEDIATSKKLLASTINNKSPILPLKDSPKNL